MKRLFIIPRLPTGGGRCLAIFAGLVALVFFLIPASILQATHVPVRNGVEVRLALRNILTTENVEKDDVIQFEVAEDVVVNGYTVIARGAPATAKVVKIKPMGKKKSKDASVTFRFAAVQTVDRQLVQLRKQPSAGEKKNDKDNDFEENNQIPGMVDRVVGADKGKLYVAYLDQAVTVNAPDTPTAAPTAPATGQTATTLTGQPATPVVQPPPAPAQELVTVDFGSDPPGADIMIDNTFSGNTPSSLQVSPGQHTIELRLSGYHTYKRDMKVSEGSHLRISPTLEKE